MRSTRHRLKCTECPAEIDLSMTFPTWAQKASQYVEKIAAAEEWDIKNRRCPLHKEQP